ncbi:MAG: cell division protein FtsH, partial [Candidatus Margulisiibacteriota bacterium]
IHIKGIKLEGGVDVEVLARRTPGFTGADLQNLVNEGAILAARRNKLKASMEEMEEAIERVIAGPAKKSKVMNDKEKDIIAYHEVGHALLAKLLPNSDPVHKISVLPRGFALGYTLQLPLEDKYLVTKEEVLSQITVLLGGRVAEDAAFKEMTSGAHNDLERATELARKMVCEYGMSDLGPRTFGKPQRQVFLGRDFGELKDYGENTAKKIDDEVDGIISVCYITAKKLIAENKSKLELIAKQLREKETLEGEELDRLFNGIKAKEVQVDKSTSENQEALF